MDMRVSKATAVVVQHVTERDVPWFMEWQREVSEASGAFPGSVGTEVYPPPGGRAGDWVAVVTFEDEPSLRAWLDSPERARLVERLRAAVGRFTLKLAPGGFGAWFAGCVGAQAPPGWKTALVVLLGLYPTVMLLSFFPGRLLTPMGFALSMLVGNALSVILLQWCVMPALNKVFGPWLTADPVRQRALHLGGLAAVLLLLAGLATLFR
ncbi:hypothetical protein NNJEOMEG_03249 [Fundidesulfovibrio magnetotacticus]|uniref:ABM domain-containing protein n=1 Tax=Fundidesulfovibrio magnetotacticus TaxID=2730080 RepID=A0A6V8M030_9BACT|nr:hypothetical protein [Fundidesulfovibrio magnetotacticus]GFK95386.1 hypothetical protein NNJEOMEG_03249 [Fundidesulfovibrio magnetotacticus]